MNQSLKYFSILFTATIFVACGDKQEKEATNIDGEKLSSAEVVGNKARSGGFEEGSEITMQKINSSDSYDIGLMEIVLVEKTVELLKSVTDVESAKKVKNEIVLIKQKTKAIKDRRGKIKRMPKDLVEEFKKQTGKRMPMALSAMMKQTERVLYDKEIQKILKNPLMGK